MADKSPKKAMAKKPGTTLKEKRSAKKLKREGGTASSMGSRSPRPGG